MENKNPTTSAPKPQAPAAQTAVAKPIEPKWEIEKTDPANLALIEASLNGDWSKATKETKVRFCAQMCAALDIHPALNPFEFITMNGKEVLYTPAEAAFLIADKQKLSIIEKECSFDKDTQILTFNIECRSQSGRVSSDRGCLFLGTLNGQNRANAIMKCLTKAKRRAILSMVGLNMTDPDEVRATPTGATIPEPTPVHATPVTPLTTPTVDKETQEAQVNLINALTAKDQMFYKQPLEAKKFIMDKAGKELPQLTVEDCEEVFAAYESQLADLQDAAPTTPPAQEPTLL